MHACFFCRRPLKSPPIFFNGQAIGPRCAVLHAVPTGKPPKHAKRTTARQAPKIERDPHTVDMFEILGDGND